MAGPSPANSPRTTPTGVKAPHGSRRFTVSWADGKTLEIPHRILRGYCPCASCQGHSGATRFVDSGDPELRDLGQVGNYALELTWADGHATGIYTFPYLRRLSDLYVEYGDALPERLPELP